MPVTPEPWTPLLFFPTMVTFKSPYVCSAFRNPDSITPLTPEATGKPLCFSVVWTASPLTWWTTEGACHMLDYPTDASNFRLCRRILLSLDINVLTLKKKNVRSIHIKTQAIHFSGRIGNSGNTGSVRVEAVSLCLALPLWGGAGPVQTTQLPTGSAFPLGGVRSFLPLPGELDR